MTVDTNHAPSKDLLDEETVFDLEDSLDALPFTPSSQKNYGDSEMSHPTNSMESQSQTSGRRDSRIKAETMLSRVSAFARVTDDIMLEDLFEYIWPEDDSDASIHRDTEGVYYVVQELLADFLKIKSFKRRYPELSRRVMDAYERSWLQSNNLVPAGRAELGLTALRSDEVMNLLQNDFPEMHVAISDLFRHRRFQKLADQQKKQYEAARIERGEARAEAARKRALESASDFNRQLVYERNRERRCYWDLQTMQIHVPKPSYRLIPESIILDQIQKKGGSYPVAVIPGQFTEKYVDLSPSELAYLPLSRALHTLPCRRPRPPAPLPTFLRYGNLRATGETPSFNGQAVVSKSLVTGTISESVKAVDSSCPTFTFDSIPSASNPIIQPSNPTPLLKSEANIRRTGDSPGPLTTAALVPTNTGIGEKATNSAKLTCTVCSQPVTDPLRCSECTRSGHPLCLELPESMIEIVKTYAWSCMDCKHCVECQDTGNEDQMMFCDRCDRGYHAFCVGLSGIPAGNWECPMCNSEGEFSSTVVSPSSKTRRSTTGRPVSSGTPIKRSGSRASLEASRERKCVVSRSTSKRRLYKRTNADTEPSIVGAINFDENSSTTQPDPSSPQAGSEDVLLLDPTVSPEPAIIQPNSMSPFD